MTDLSPDRHFPGSDATGDRTLEAFAEAPRFNRWMFERIRPWLGKRIAEVGSGIGNLSQYLTALGPVLLTDPDTDHLARLRLRWASAPDVRIERLDLSHPEDLSVLQAFAPDTVVLLNVLEHIADDVAALRNLHACVAMDCAVVVLVPYGKGLYSEFDKALGHHRRYGRGELQAAFERAGFTVVHQEHFHKAGRIPWYLQLTLGGGRAIPGGQLRIYDLLTPVLRLWDRVMPGPGLSTIVVARKS